MRALIDQFALLQYQYPVSPTNLAQPVRNKESRLLLAYPTHRLLNSVLRSAVYGAGAIIQYQDVRIGEKCPCNGYALALTTGQRNPSLANFGLVSILKSGDEIVSLSLAGGSLDIILAGIRAAKGDVLTDGTGK